MEYHRPAPNLIGHLQFSKYELQFKKKLPEPNRSGNFFIWWEEMIRSRI